ncbi:MAG: response regulator [Oscillochloridaceae bacterium umkhey_bin13]
MLRFRSHGRTWAELAAGPEPMGYDEGLAVAPGCHADDLRLRVLIVDDHPPIRDWVRTTLTPHGFAVVEARSGDEALAMVRQGLGVSAAICDVLMPHAEIEGIAAARVLWHEYNVPCLILTSVQEAGSRLAAVYAGAMGYVLKDAAQSDLLVRSIQAIVKGQRPSDALAAIAISTDEARQISETRTAQLRAIAQLTPQQRVVAALILQGKTNQEIAEALVLSRGTVNSHVSNILQRLNLATRREVRTRILLDLPGQHPEGSATERSSHAA